MKELNLHEEIIKSLSLMLYDRSLTLNEQKTQKSSIYTWEDPLEPEDDKDKKKSSFTPPAIKPTYSVTSGDEERRQRQQKEENIDKILDEFMKGAVKACNNNLNEKIKYQYQKIGREVFLELRDEVGVQEEFKWGSPSTWLEPSAWGTSDSDILDALKKIKNRQTYYEVLKYIWSCYPKHGITGDQSTILKFLQDEEYSKASKFAKLLKNVPGFTQHGYQYYFNDEALESFESVLKKFHPKEKVQYETIEGSDLKSIAKIMLPPLVRETLHVILPILSAIVVVASGGAASFLGKWALYGIIELADAMLYVVDENKFMAGLSLFFALIPANGLFKILPSMRKLVAKGGKNAVFTFIDKIGGKITEPLTKIELSIVKELSTSAARGMMVVAFVRAQMANLLKKSLAGKTAYYFVKGLLVLVKNGYLLAEFLTSMGLFIGGAFWTWGKIANAIGLGEEVNDIVKDDTIQPTEESLDDYSNNLYTFLKTYYDYNQTLSKSKYNYPEPTVFFLQKFLEKSGSNYITPFWDNQTTNTNKDMVTYNMGGIKQKEGNKIFIFINERPNKGSLIDKVGQEIEIKNTSFDGKYKIKGLSYNKDNKVQGIYIETNFKPKKGVDVDLTYKNKGVINIKSFIKGLTQGSPVINQGLGKSASKVYFKYGYFGDNTFESVKTYQKKNNINPTGIVDKTTLKSIMSDLKSKKYGKLTISQTEYDKYGKLKEQKPSKTVNPTVEKQVVTYIYKDNGQAVADSILNSNFINESIPYIDPKLLDMLGDTTVTIKQ